MSSFNYGAFAKFFFYKITKERDNYVSGWVGLDLMRNFVLENCPKTVLVRPTAIFG